MLTDVNGCSTCTKGAEFWETFNHRGKTFVQYDYRHESGELFSTCKPTLSECREARDKHFQS